MSFTKNEVEDVLRNVIHPTLNISIIELEMVKNLHVNGGEISFELGVNKKTATNIPVLKKMCIHAIEEKFGEKANVRGNIKVVQEAEPENALSKVKHIIAVSSGKGGVGKSTVSVNLAVALANTGAKVGIIDADIFGPSIPKMFGMESAKPDVFKHEGKEIIIPVEKYGVKILSLGFFVNPDDAMIWRGPMASNALTQITMNSDWGELDYLILDLPPGTSDIHLTAVSIMKITGAIVVSTPQDIALADAIKGINMFRSEKINVPVLGLIENMAWFTPAELPNNKYYIFGKGGAKNLAGKMNIPFLGEVPIVQSIREGGDSGKPVATNPESITGMAFQAIAQKVVDAVS